MAPNLIMILMFWSLITTSTVLGAPPNIRYSVPEFQQFWRQAYFTGFTGSGTSVDFSALCLEVKKITEFSELKWHNIIPQQKKLTLIDIGIDRCFMLNATAITPEKQYVGVWVSCHEVNYTVLLIELV